MSFVLRSIKTDLKAFLVLKKPLSIKFLRNFG